MLLSCVLSFASLLCAVACCSLCCASSVLFPFPYRPFFSLPLSGWRGASFLVAASSVVSCECCGCAVLRCGLVWFCAAVWFASPCCALRWCALRCGVVLFLAVPRCAVLCGVARRCCAVRCVFVLLFADSVRCCAAIRYSILCGAVQGGVVPCCAVLCCSSLFLAVLCGVVPRDAMLCYAM